MPRGGTVGMTLHRGSNIKRMLTNGPFFSLGLTRTQSRPLHGSASLPITQLHTSQTMLGHEHLTRRFLAKLALYGVHYLETLPLRKRPMLLLLWLTYFVKKI